MKIKLTKKQASVTIRLGGRYVTFERGKEYEVDEGEGNALLNSGHFEKIEEVKYGLVPEEMKKVPEEFEISGIKWTVKELKRTTKSNLVDICKSLKVSPRGTKKVLIERIVEKVA